MKFDIYRYYSTGVLQRRKQMVICHYAFYLGGNKLGKKKKKIGWEATSPTPFSYRKKDDQSN
jgi:hypothetical protein